MKNIIFNDSIEYVQKKLKDILKKVSTEDIETVKNLFLKANKLD